MVIDRSCGDRLPDVAKGWKDPQDILDKAHRRLLAIKSGDTEAAAIYQRFFGKGKSPDDIIDWVQDL
ncbi:MAG: hypothetical protein M1816_003169 [Peltula sp. TS41687]|nr:MAG: hypothetical protein M1816_003169 [Peltula sp. TS41687]